jgi:hypothetical protein
MPVLLSVVPFLGLLEIKLFQTISAVSTAVSPLQHTYAWVSGSECEPLVQGKT